MSQLLSVLRRFDAVRDGDIGGDLIDRRVLDSIEPDYSEEPVTESLGESIRSALDRIGIHQLYQHQSEAISHSIRGANVVLQAPTASGKTLAFQIPMLDALQESRSHALMIYPTKALAIDQREQLECLTSEIPGPKFESWWYDGDTNYETRKLMRENPPKILITNPDMLHNSFLGHSKIWKKFYEGLKFVVIDEIHEYRGYFGSNVAMILRRFSYHLASLGIRPNFFLCSATCANAREHAENLTGLDFVEINASSGMRPKREFIFVRPEIPDHRYWDILQVRTVMAGLACVSEGKSLLAFCPTRKFAEACYRIAIRELENRAEAGKPIVCPDSVKVFRSGLSSEERHAVQKGLKSGDIQLVFTTNALEMGIDIGGLDGVIIAGFPDSLMSAWQRIGRAGRSWKSEAFVLYFARNNPLDRFYATNLDTCLSKPLDDLVVNPENEDLVTKHLASVMFETPELNEDVNVVGPEMERRVRENIAKGKSPVAPGKFIPHSGLNIRGGGAGMFVLKVGKEDIGTISAQQQFREAPQGAIYMHGGRSYRVNEITYASSTSEILLEPVDPWLKTNITTYTNVSNQEIFLGRRWVVEDGTEVHAFYGKVLITESITSVQVVNEKNDQVLENWTPQNNSARFNDAHAFWILRLRSAQSSASFNSASTPAINAFQQFLRVGALFTVPLDAHDIFPHANVSEQSAYIVESYPGGIGVAKKLLERWRDVLQVGMKVAYECNCTKGCPNCIVPPRSTADMDKNEARLFAQSLLDSTKERETDVYDQNSGFWKSVK